MNKELIKKYKKEFDHFLNGGELLTRTKSNFIWNDNINEDLMWNFEIQDIDIIINDEYVELRKALAEGKIIQCNIIEGQSEQHWYAFKDKQWYDTTEFKYSINKYRIKPEEPQSQFKVCDFVRHRHLKTCHIVTNINQGEFSDKISTRPSLSFDDDFSSEYIKWTPSHKELCYFTHDTNTKTSAILREFREISKDGFYVDCFGSRFIYCEPFLNSKPSWFKD